MKFNDLVKKIISKKHKKFKNTIFTGYADKDLVENKLINEDDLTYIYSQILNLPIFKFEKKLEKLSNLISFELMEKGHFLLFEDEELICLIDDPLTYFDYDDYLIEINQPIRKMLINTSQFEKMQKYCKFKNDDLSQDNTEINTLQEEEKIKYEDVDVSVNVQIVNTWLNKAIMLGASDIHIEPGTKYGLIRIRLDGKLTTMEKIDNNIYDELVSRIKVLSGVDITQKLVPQDGKFYYYVDNKKYDLRLSTITTITGEKVVLRVLENQKIQKNFSILCYSEEEETKIKNLLKEDNGVILVTGPTGSGKTTTLYTYLQELINDTNNIVTVEDPVEYTIEGINQIQVNQSIGLTFGTILRSILRQDPNIIMIGEIRDEETAQIAMRASISGHLVLSTMHTNYAVGSIVRLLDMGIQKYLVSSAVRGVVSQKLVQKLCPKCKIQVKLTPEEKTKYGFNSRAKIYKKGGCEQCYYTGYSGRILLSEILIVDDHIKDMILHDAGEKAINDYLTKQKMITLEQKLNKAIEEGIVSIEEYK